MFVCNATRIHSVQGQLLFVTLQIPVDPVQLMLNVHHMFVYRLIVWSAEPTAIVQED